MKIALFTALICLAAAMPQVRQVANINHPDKIPGEFLVVLNAPVGKNVNFIYATKVSSKIAAISSKISIVNMFTNLKSPILHVKTTDESVMSQLFQLEEVKLIDANIMQQMIEQDCSSQDTGNTLWGLSRTSARDAPDYTGATYSYSSSDGSGVRLYVLDTSIRITHVDFEGRAEFGSDQIGDGEADINGHGTHCAGTVGGATYGVSKGVTLVAVKVLSNQGSGSTAQVVAGVNWMVGDVESEGVRGAGSMSLGGGPQPALDEAVNSAVAARIPVVVAAGNSNANACNFSPARASGAITVGATDINENLSSFSNWGPCVNILAPGSNILSTSHLSDTGSRTLSGTSMACPHVAGLVGTYLSANPDASTDDVLEYLTSTATQDAINVRGEDTPNLLMYSICDE